MFDIVELCKPGEAGNVLIKVNERRDLKFTNGIVKVKCERLSILTYLTWVNISCSISVLYAEC